MPEKLFTSFNENFNLMNVNFVWDELIFLHLTSFIDIEDVFNKFFLSFIQEVDGIFMKDTCVDNKIQS